MIADGQFIGTFTGRHGAGLNLPQPAIWTTGNLHEQRGVELFPRINSGQKDLVMSGRHINKNANIIVNGRKASGRITLKKEDVLIISLDKHPATGINFLQIQNPDGLFSNDFCFFVETFDETAARRKSDPAALKKMNLFSAIRNNNMEELKIAIASGAPLDKTDNYKLLPIRYATHFGRPKMVKLLKKHGAK